MFKKLKIFVLFIILFISKNLIYKFNSVSLILKNFTYWTLTEIEAIIITVYSNSVLFKCH